MDHLRAEELRRRILIGIVGRHVDEAINIVFRNSFGNPLGAFDMDVFQIKVPYSKSAAGTDCISSRTYLVG